MRKAIYLFVSAAIIGVVVFESSSYNYKVVKELAASKAKTSSTEAPDIYLNLKELQLAKKLMDKQREIDAWVLSEKLRNEEAALMKKVEDKKKAEQKRQEELKAQEELKRSQEAEREAQLALTDNNARAKIFEYMSNEVNRRSVMNAALRLNHGTANNACVYFASEVFRRVNINIPVSTENCTQLTNILKNRGWRINLDYKSLEKGDLCFTTDAFGGKGAPTHAYIFMGWVEQGKYDYAYIVDNQEPKYGSIYHIRNIAKADYYGGEAKEAFRYFMRR